MFGEVVKIEYDRKLIKFNACDVTLAAKQNILTQVFETSRDCETRELGFEFIEMSDWWHAEVSL